jgi:hypothetical protein
VRSCVGCETNPVPGLETCWPSWEAQFLPEVKKFWCKRALTHPGYDAVDLKAKHRPNIAPIPCWQTCWEPISWDGGAARPTCLIKDAPDPRGGAPGPSCSAQPSLALRCSPSCGAPLHETLRGFWEQHWMRLPEVRDEAALNIICPKSGCGAGG